MPTGLQEISRVTWTAVHISLQFSPLLSVPCYQVGILQLYCHMYDHRVVGTFKCVLEGECDLKSDKILNLESYKI